MPFIFNKTEIEGVIFIEPEFFEDDRGFFLEVFKESEFHANGIKESFSQINHSYSNENVLRGLHYQLNPNAQGKLIRVLAGCVFDVAVDLRKGSPSFGKWVARELSSTIKNMLYIPQGFAHGFCVLSEGAEVVYYCTSEYSPENDRSILWNDNLINIDWPISRPVLSDKDAHGLSLNKADCNFVYNQKGFIEDGE